MKSFNGKTLRKGDIVIVRDGSTEHWIIQSFDDPHDDCGVNIKNSSGQEINRLSVNLISVFED